MTDHAVTYRLDIRTIRKEQRRIAALLQRSDVSVNVPQNQRSERGSMGKLAGGRRGRSVHLVIPQLVKERSRSLDSLYEDPDSGRGTWTDRPTYVIDIPRMDPLSERNTHRTTSIKTRDIEKFDYSSLKKEDEIILPPIPRKKNADNKLGRNASFTMYVPNNTPIPMKRRDRRGHSKEKSQLSASVYNIREDEETSGFHRVNINNYTNSYPTAAGNSYTNSYSTSTEYNNYKQNSHFSNHIRYRHTDVFGNENFPSTGRDLLQGQCMCTTPNPNHSNPDQQQNDVICLNCGGHINTPDFNGDIHLASNRKNPNSRENTGYSSEYVRMSTYSSFSEYNPSVVDEAWRQKLGQTSGGGLGSREPSVVVRPYGRSHTNMSELTDHQKTGEGNTRGILTSGKNKSNTAKRTRFNELSNGDTKAMADKSTVSEAATDKGLVTTDKSLVTTDKSLGAAGNSLAMTATDLSKVPSEAYRRALAFAQKDKMPDDPHWYYDRITRPFVFSYFQSIQPPCNCGSGHPHPRTGKHQQLGKSEQKTQADKKENKKSKKKPKKSKKATGLKHILGKVNMYDFYPGGKYNSVR